MRLVAAILAAVVAWASPVHVEAARMPTVSADPVIRQAVGDAGDLASLVRKCDMDPARFAWTVLGDVPDKHGEGGLWSMQRRICRSIAHKSTTVVVAGNAVGKTHLAARIALWFLYRRVNSMVVSTAPTIAQLDGVLWNGIRAAHAGSKVPLGGEITGSSPIILELGPKWYALGHSANTVEGMSGHHAENLLFIADEASGVSPAKFEAGNSLIPSRKLYIGNPLTPDTPFHEAARVAERAMLDDPHNPDYGFFRIPSTMSPHAGRETSPFGLACLSWLRQMRMEYGEDSIWWLAHVLAQFPGDVAETLLKEGWLDACGHAIHVRGGPTRTAVDIGAGNGGDLTVVMTRDDNGILAMDWSNQWDLGEAAAVVARHVKAWKVHPARVSYDLGGPGQDFDNRLQAAGVHGARAYLCQWTAENADKLRSAAARLLRFRLDPGYLATTPAGVMVPQVPFAISPDWLKVMRPQLRALRYVLDPLERFAMELQKDLKARLKKSPDFAETLIQSFAFPD